MKSIKFYIADDNDEREFDGFSEGKTWNGYDVVLVSPKVFLEFKETFGDCYNDDELGTFKPDHRGLISLDGVCTFINN